MRRRIVVSPSFQRAIDAALAQMHAHSCHDLRMHHRYAIYLALSEPRQTRGHYMRRGWIDVLASERVFPLWQQWCDHYRPEDTRATDILRHTMRALRRNDTPCGLLTVAEPSWSWVFEQGYLSEAGDIPPRPILSAFSAIAVTGMHVGRLVAWLNTHPWRDDLDETPINPFDPDRDEAIDYEDLDTALWVSDAMAPSDFLSEDESRLPTSNTGRGGLLTLCQTRG